MDTYTLAMNFHNPNKNRLVEHNGTSEEASDMADELLFRYGDVREVDVWDSKGKQVKTVRR